MIKFFVLNDQKCTYSSAKRLEKDGVIVTPLIWNDENVAWEELENKLCIMRTPWNYTQKYDEWCAWLQKMKSINLNLLNDCDTLLWNSHKRYLLNLEQHKVPIVPTHLLPSKSSVYDVEEVMNKRNWDFVIVKPAIGSFGNDVILLKRTDFKKDNSTTLKHIQNMLEHEDMLVQPFISSVKSRGEVSIIYLNGKYSYGIKKTPMNGEFKVQGGKMDNYTPSTEELELSQKVINLCPAIIHGDFGTKKKNKKDKHPLLYGRIDILTSNEGKDLLVSEVEILDPELFWRKSPEGVETMCKLILERMELNTYKFEHDQ